MRQCMGGTRACVPAPWEGDARPSLMRGRHGLPEVITRSQQSYDLGNRACLARQPRNGHQGIKASTGHYITVSMSVAVRKPPSRPWVPGRTALITYRPSWLLTYHESSVII